MRFLQETIDTSAMLSSMKLVKKFAVVGSALIDEKSAADLDFLVLIDANSFLTDGRWAFGTDWHLCAGEYSDTDDSWGAIRKGVVNLIVTVDPEWYSRALTANEVCVALKIADKGDRIVVYRVIRDGYDAAQAQARRNGER